MSEIKKSEEGQIFELDQNVVEALDAYFKYGINGGSFVNALLAQDYKEALLTAHELLSRRSIISHMEYTKQLLALHEIDTRIPDHYCKCCGMPPHNCLKSHDDYED